jgi:hypothetical protein
MPTPPATVNAPVAVEVDAVALVMESAVDVVAPRPVTVASVSASAPPPAAQLKVPLVSDDNTYPFTAATAEGNVKVYEPLAAGFSVNTPALVLSI